MASVASSLDERLRRMVEDNFDGLFRYLRRLGVPLADVEDAIQEVAARTAPRLHGIEVGREKAFAYGTAFRVASEWRRAAWREVKGDELDELEAGGPTPEASWDDKRARALLDRIVAEMPLVLRAVFLLYEIEEHTMAEIADELEIPPGTVASRLRRARVHFDDAVAAFERRDLRVRPTAESPGARGV